MTHSIKPQINDHPYLTKNSSAHPEHLANCHFTEHWASKASLLWQQCEATFQHTVQQRQCSYSHGVLNSGFHHSNVKKMHQKCDRKRKIHQKAIPKIEAPFLRTFSSTSETLFLSLRKLRFNGKTLKAVVAVSFSHFGRTAQFVAVSENCFFHFARQVLERERALSEIDSKINKNYPFPKNRSENLRSERRWPRADVRNFIKSRDLDQAKHGKNQVFAFLRQPHERGKLKNFEVADLCRG